MKLNQLSDRPGAHRRAKRLGRGIGSGKGKTAGRGHKGQRSRSGVALKGFEGGQMPIHRRVPKRGFHNINRTVPDIVNLGRLQIAIDRGKIDSQKPVTIPILREAGLVGSGRDGVRLLAKGELKTKVEIEVSGASGAAVEAVEKAGGTVRLTAAPKPAGRSERGTSASGAGKAPPPSRPKGKAGTRPRAPASAASGSERHAISRRATCLEPELRRPVQGDRAQETHLVHAGRADHLPARYLHPDSRHRSRSSCRGVSPESGRRSRHVRHVRRAARSVA